MVYNATTAEPVSAMDRMMQCVKDTHDASIVFKFSSDLAQLSKAEYAAVKVQLKRILPSLNTRDLDGAVKEARETIKRTNSEKHLYENGLPIIEVDGQHLRDMSWQAVNALHDRNQIRIQIDARGLFIRDNQLVRVVDGNDGRPLIQEVGVDELRGMLDRVANFVAIRSEGYTPASPPNDVIRDILTHEDLPFPVLRGVVEQPVLRSDGTILDRPGYDPSTGLVYAPAKGLNIPPVPENPTQEEVRQALELLREPFCDFPFVDESDRANALALLMTPFVVPAIAGNIPVALIKAWASGTGKQLLADVVSFTATGQHVDVIQVPESDAEWRKQITSLLMGGSQLVLLDEVGKLHSPKFASLLTARYWRDRVLRTNDMVRLPNDVVWMAAGNDLEVGGDLPRRSYLIRLEAQMYRPENRSPDDFKYPDLAGWVLENRGRLIHAILTLARAWYAAGKPTEGVPTVGGFVTWAQTVGGILKFAGQAGFLQNRTAIYERFNPDEEEWRNFFEAWLEVFDKPVTVKEVTEALAQVKEDPSNVDSATQQLYDALPGTLTHAFEGEEGSLSRKLGKALAGMENQRIREDGLRVVKAGKKQRAITWEVMHD